MLGKTRTPRLRVGNEYHARKCVDVDGTILIITLWILSILTVFAVSVGHRMSLEVRLAEYQIDNLRLLNICSSAIHRAVFEKEKELETAFSDKVDALSEGWSNNPETFKEKKFGDGKFTVGYNLKEKEADEDYVILYGMSDESSRININEAGRDILKALIEPYVESEQAALGIAAAIIDWRDENIDPQLVNGAFVGQEDYISIGLSYECKNKPFDTVEELLLVEGIDQKIFNGIKDYVTVYGDGKININTASFAVLDSLFRNKFTELAGKIIEYRKGIDGISGTDDDRWFVNGSLVIDREEKGLVETKNLDGAFSPDPYFAATSEEWGEIQKLSKGDEPILKVNSYVFRADVSGSIRKLRKNVMCVVQIKQNQPAEVLYWHEN